MEIDVAEWLSVIESAIEEAAEEGMDSLGAEAVRVFEEDTQRGWKAKWSVEVVKPAALERDVIWGRQGDIDKPIPYFLNFGVKKMYAAWDSYESKTTPGSLQSGPGGGVGKVIREEPIEGASIIPRDFDIELCKHLSKNVSELFKRSK